VKLSDGSPPILRATNIPTNRAASRVSKGDLPSPQGRATLWAFGLPHRLRSAVLAGLLSFQNSHCDVNHFLSAILAHFDCANVDRLLLVETPTARMAELVALERLAFASSADYDSNIESLRKHPGRLVVTFVDQTHPARVRDDPASNMLHNVRAEPTPNPHLLKVTLAEIPVVDHTTPQRPKLPFTAPSILMACFLSHGVFG
jgi:hypothetical protein